MDAPAGDGRLRHVVRRGTLAECGLALICADAPARAEIASRGGLCFWRQAYCAATWLVADTTLGPATWPADVENSCAALIVADEQPLSGWAVALSILLGSGDVVAFAVPVWALLKHSNAAGLILAALIYAPTQADAQADDSFALQRHGRDDAGLCWCHRHASRSTRCRMPECVG